MESLTICIMAPMTGKIRQQDQNASDGADGPDLGDDAVQTKLGERFIVGKRCEENGHKRLAQKIPESAVYAGSGTCIKRAATQI